LFSLAAGNTLTEMEGGKHIKEQEVLTEKEKWLLCPVCKSKTRTKVREDTVLENFPMFCSKCKTETIITARQMNMIVILEPDA